MSSKYDRLYSAYLAHTHEQLLKRLDFQDTGSLEVLDLSAGTGILAESLIETFGPPARLVLNDPAEMMLDIAKERLRHFPDVEYHAHFAEELNRLDGPFDHIICLNSFHYFVDQPLVLDHIRKLLKPGGTLWMQDWNRKGFFRIAIRLIDLLSPEHISTRNIDEMKSMLKERDFQIHEEEHWRFRWWNFFFLKATLPVILEKQTEAKSVSE